MQRLAKPLGLFERTPCCGAIASREVMKRFGLCPVHNCRMTTPSDNIGILREIVGPARGVAAPSDCVHEVEHRMPTSQVELTCGRNHVIDSNSYVHVYMLGSVGTHSLYGNC